MIPGWLELRKGFHTLLTETGVLVILRDNVLFSHLHVPNATTSNQLLQRAQKVRKGAPVRDAPVAAAVVEAPVTTASDAESSVGAGSAVAAVDEKSLHLTVKYSTDAILLENRHQLTEVGHDHVRLSYSDSQLAVFNKSHYDVLHQHPDLTSSGNNTLQIGNWCVAFELVENENTAAAPAEVSVASLSIAAESQTTAASAAAVNDAKVITGFRNKVAYGQHRHHAAAAAPTEVGNVLSAVVDAVETPTVSAAATATVAISPVTNAHAMPTSHRNIKKKLNKQLASDKQRVLTALEELLPGSFSYSMQLPAHTLSTAETDNRQFYGVDLRVFSHDLLGHSGVGMFDVEENPLSLLSIDIRSVEGRLRDGLPLLVPAAIPVDSAGRNRSSTVSSVDSAKAVITHSLKLTYTFVESAKRTAGTAH